MSIYIYNILIYNINNYILISHDIVDCINLLNETREQAKIPLQNPYVFGIYNYRGNKNKFIRAREVMRNYADACGAKRPELLRATYLRKHIATKCVSLRITDSQIDDLANHLGHHKDIHKRYYRQPIPEPEISKVAGLLENVIATESDEESCTESTADHTDDEDGSIILQSRKRCGNFIFKS